MRYEECKDYVAPEETFPEVGGCTAFKRKRRGKFRTFLTCLPGSLLRTIKYAASIPFWRWFE